MIIFKNYQEGNVLNKEKILVISTGCGFNRPNSGDHNRFFNIASQLAKGFQIIIIQPYHNKDAKDILLKNIKVQYFNSRIFGITSGILADLNPSFILLLLNILKKRDIHLIQISHPPGIFISRFLSIILDLNIKIIYDAHNVDSESVKQNNLLISNSTSFFDFVKIKFTIYYVIIIERFAVKFCDNIITVSDNDKFKFINKFHKNPEFLTTIPNGVDIASIDSTVSRNNKETNKSVIEIVFHGSCSQGANMFAHELIINYIAPQYNEMYPYEKVQFVLIGSKCKKFCNKSVTSLGFINDLYSRLKSTDIGIVPIIAGGGTKLKILDYFGLGIPIVTTTKGIEGIKAINNIHAIMIDNIDDSFFSCNKFLS